MTAAELPSIEDLEAAGVTLDDLEDAVARDDFGEWLPRVSPPPWRWDWPHLKHIRGYLDRVTAGEITRLIIATQPQVGKTEQDTVRYPAWRMERDPTLRQAVACYDQKHAKRISRKIRKIVRSRKVALSKERRATEEWETRDGGFLKAVGVGSGITGTALDILHVDDPIRGYEEAQSAAYRDRLWGWFAEDLMTRLQKNGAVIITMTLWHMDDLVGRILNGPGASRWTFVRLPAEAEEDDPLGRPEGAPLCPDRFDKAQLEEKRETLGQGYYGLYQCRPVPRGGAMFKAEWFEKSWVTPSQVPQLATLVRHWDLAATLDGDWTAGVLMGRSADNLFYVLDVTRGRWPPAERDRVIRETASRDGRNVLITIGKDPGQAGVSQVAGIVGQLAGFRAEGVRETGSKESRADAFASQLQAGNVRMIRAGWAATFESEFLSFPHGKYDDQVDAASSAFNNLAAGGSVYDTRGLLTLGGGVARPVRGDDFWGEEW